RDAIVGRPLPSAVRLAELRLLRARSAAVSGRAFVAIAARRTARNRERRAAARRRVRAALRLHFVEDVLRLLRPLWTLGIARTRAGRLRVVTWGAIVVPVLGTRA